MLKVDDIVRLIDGNYGRIVGWSENEVIIYVDFSEFEEYGETYWGIYDSAIEEVCNYVESPLWRVLND